MKAEGRLDMLIAPLRRLLASPRGFTLLEVLVIVGIFTVVTGVVGRNVFQALSIQRFWREQVVATKELRHAGSIFAGDAVYAQTTSLVEGAPPVSSVTLDWTDRTGVPHTATYTLSGSILFRQYDGATISVARRVVNAGFSLSGRMLTFDLEVEAERGGTDSISHQVFLRRLQQ